VEGNGYYQRIQYNGGTSWTINARVLWGTNYRQSPSIVISKDSYLYLTYWHSDDGVRYIRYTPIPSVSWSSDYTVHNVSGSAPMSRGHNSTEVYILFRSDMNNANYDIVYRKFWRNNNSLSGNISVTNDNTGHSSPSCVLGPYGTKIDFIWRQGTSSPYNLYYGRILEGKDAICGHPALSINVSPSQWNLGEVDIGDTKETTGFYFNLTSEGDVALDITINATNAKNTTHGAKWNLTTTPGHDNFSLQYNLSGAGTWTNINITFDTFITDLVIGGYQTFDLKLLMATTSSTVDPMGVTVTFKSVAS